ncbi:MAG: hypothetical protein ACFHW5_11685 [Verrucomicrobiota bacterium]
MIRFRGRLIRKRLTKRQVRSMRMRDPRFRQYLSLALEGNKEAIADLFREYSFKFGEEEP